MARKARFLEPMSDADAYAYMTEAYVADERSRYCECSW